MSTQHRSGPVRSDTAREAILAATTELFEERGHRLTMEGIAQRAGVSKQTVYRWWKTKGAVISECLFTGRIMPDCLELRDTGDLRRDLRDWLGRLQGLLQSPQGEGLLRSLLAAAVEYPEVGRQLGEVLSGDDAVKARFEAAVARGELSDRTPIVEVSEAVVGVLLLRAVTRVPVDEVVVDRLFDVLQA